MNSKRLQFPLSLLLAIVLLVSSCNSNKEKSMTQNATTNPLLEAWTGPYNGVPPLDKIKETNFEPALEAGMAELSAEIDAITSNTDAPTFNNTIVAMEKSGSTLNRVINLYYVWGSNLNTPSFQEIDAVMQPKITAFYDKINQNDALFKRIETVYNSTEKDKLAAEQQRLVYNYYKDFVFNGAKLDADTKTKVADINQKLAALQTKFSQNLLADEEGITLDLTEAEAKALPEALRENAAEMAKSKKSKGWVVANTRSSIEPFLTYCTDRSLRQKAWNMFVNRGDNGDTHDNNNIITQILSLRAQKAKLMGYQTHAHWRLSDKMAKTPEKAMELLLAVWKPAVNRVKEEVADMQKIADLEKANITIAPWDYRFYAEKVRKAKYALDVNEVKP